jgi:DnaJ homolog subfamily A member 2
MVKDTILYDELNVNPQSNENEIKKAYRKLSMKWHPDKNLDNKEEAKERFQKISEAYSILSNKEKRELYDQVGVDILKNGADGPPVDPSKIFEQFFGGFNGFGGFPFGNMGGPQHPQRQQEDHCVVEHFVTLEEIYNEKTTVINFKQKNYCKDCDGTGSKTKKKVFCKECNGNGKKVEVRQMGPMIQQFMTNCNSCNGVGEYIDPSNRCNSCNGREFIIKNKSINIPLKKELAEGSQIRLSGKGHNLKNGKSTLIIVIKEREHHTFKRVDNDLHIKLEVPLFEDLYGFKKVIKHLDGRKLLVKNNKMLNGEGILLVRNEGMYGQNGRKGNMFIHLKTIYPNLSKLEENENDVLRKLLIKLNISEYKESNKINEEECMYVNSNLIDNSNFNDNNQEYQNNDNEERVQCAQQ